MVRHGDTALNSGHTSPEKFRGHADVPLSAEGRAEGKALAKKLCGTDEIDCVYSSDLSRASDVGQMIADQCDCELITDKNLRPWDLGSLTGTPVKEGIPKIKQYANTPTVPLPGGESFNSFKEKVLTALDGIFDEAIEEKETYVVVTHTRDLQLLKGSYTAPGGLSNHNIDIKTFDDYSNELSTGEYIKLEFTGKEWKMIKEPK